MILFYKSAGFVVLYYVFIANPNAFFAQNSKNHGISNLTDRFYLKAKLNTPKSGENEKGKLLILYAYFEKDARYIETLKYFIELSVDKSDSIDYLFIIQGNKTVEIPQFKNVKVLQRSKDCYDFGAYGAGFIFLGGLDALKQYSHFMFINPSAVGQILVFTGARYSLLG